MTYEKSARLAAPVERVYALLSDTSRVKEWRDDLVSSERVGPPGPLDGATFRETVKTPMGQQTVSVKITSHENRDFNFEVLDGPLRPKGTMTLKDVGGSTELTYKMELKPMFGIPSPLDAVAGTYLSQSMEKSLARLRTIVEA